MVHFQIEKLTPVQPLSSSHVAVHGVGISIAFDRLVAVIEEDEQVSSSFGSVTAQF